MDITIKGRSYPVPSFSTLKIMPFLTAMGLSYEDLSGQGAIASDPTALGRQVLTALGEPTNHYKLAFGLSQLAPSIDPQIASFEVVEEGGQKRHKFCLELEPADLIGVLNQINQHFLRLAAQVESGQQPSQELTVDLDPDSKESPLPPAEDGSQFTAPLPQTLVQRREPVAKPKGFAPTPKEAPAKEAPAIDGSQARVVRLDGGALGENGQEPQDLNALLDNLTMDQRIQLLTDAIARRGVAGQTE